MGSDLELDDGDVDSDNQRGLETYALDQYGLAATEKAKVENWIMKNNKALVRDQTYHRDTSCKERNMEKHFRKNDTVTSQTVRTRRHSHSDGESSDSAFGGSDGNILRSDDTRSHFGFINSHACVRTSTPHELAPLDEPPPDYPASGASGSVRSNTSYSSELSRVLNDFEGHLNKYDNESLEHSHRRFYTVRSIIYL